MCRDYTLLHSKPTVKNPSIGYFQYNSKLKLDLKLQFHPINQAQSEWALQALADISRSGYVVRATKPVHRLQIRPILHN